jgi:hypothetical protein
MNFQKVFIGVCFAATSIAPATHSQSAETPAIVVIIDFRGDDTGALILNILDWVATKHHFSCRPGPADFLEGRIYGSNGEVVRVPYLLDGISVRCDSQSKGHVTAFKGSATRITLSGYYETSSAGSADQTDVDGIMALVETAIKGDPRIQHIDQTTYLSEPAHVNIK